MAFSPNFAFLENHDVQLVRLGTLAERYFKDDPITCLMKLRQFGELLAQLVAANTGLYGEPGEDQLKLLNRLGSNNLIPGDVGKLFHGIRKAGNEANHRRDGDHGTALHCLKYARQLGIWYHRTFDNDKNFQPGAFIPPSNPVNETEALKQELESLRQEAQASRTLAELAQARELEERELREIAEKLLTEIEKETRAGEQRLAQLQSVSAGKSNQIIQLTVPIAEAAETGIDLDEGDTRNLIDAQLREAGWEVDSQNLTYAGGTRPIKNRNIAIAEYPTRNGRADYALFVGLQLVAMVEAKRACKDVSGAVDQAKRYSKGYEIQAGENQPTGGPWRDYKVPFVFATNGRAFLQQIRTKSGIWFCDVRKPDNLRRPLQSWYSPGGLMQLLSQDIEVSHERLKKEKFTYNVGLRNYQIEAIETLEGALAESRQELLVAMATGTGKTKTAIVLVYRLLKSKRFRRVLFLVDRSALGEQASGAFKETRLENLQTFADIFEVRELGVKTDDPGDTKVHIATVQSFVKRLFCKTDDAPPPTVDQYDCIIVDECHRGYLLDKELSETELTYRDFNDYISKYRRVLEYFDAVKIGLTATPALHTSQIFGDPIFTYSYREAVIDGWLIDHEPPIRIITELSEDGIKWDAGDAIEFFDPLTGEIDLIHAPDEVTIEIDRFNRRVVTESFNRVICEQLAGYIDPFSPEKTLIFCVTDVHADMVVDLLKQALELRYGSIEDDAVMKITGNADKPLQKIRQYRNEVNPKIAVTVDLLTTGIDVPPITNLVFLRRVNSRILYEQMLGRATRRCDEIGKEVFRVFDAVFLYEAIARLSNMKTVAVNPNITFAGLVNELSTVENEAALPEIVEQLLVKLQRKRRHLNDEGKEQIETLAGMSIADMVTYIKENEPKKVGEWFRDKAQIAQILDRRDGGRQPLLISHHEDGLRRIEVGYGDAVKPEDYLDGFSTFLRENINKIPGLMVVTQRPRELTRQGLKELKLVLDAAGYNEKRLQVAWREMKGEDIAASIIGFVRQAALGDALIPYSERVDRAIRKILAGRNWAPVQRQWLDRIGKQLKAETIVDREAFDAGEFKNQAGGFKRINKIFNEELERILEDINESIWKEAK
ncbi:MAG: hypothetical protein N5P05_004425 (plasmid) [Chroococcopsis gigantea SAG 12.99]|jgi:type I restriction enzyme R subunit|nr:type I restriction-modification system endonuclease [Chlorogloea purpurea SAG 13.99]MDV3002770.1 hypothetical protein [Chroococcopsis gigantea SAG 12.99]